MKNTTYEVFYYTLEPSYYDRSERNYVIKTFTDRQEALDFAEEAKRFHPAQIKVKSITEEYLLDLRDTENYKENRVEKNEKK